MARSEARAAAMQWIYAEMLGGEGGADALAELLGVSPPTGEDRVYIDETAGGVLGHAETLDAQIARYLVKWTLERISRVDLAILRLAVYEICYREDVPDAVAINEAVELSHVYSTDEAGGFINGVLGSLLRERNAAK